MNIFTVKNKSDDQEYFSKYRFRNRGSAGGMQTDNESGIGDTDHSDSPDDQYQRRNPGYPATRKFVLQEDHRECQ